MTPVETGCFRYVPVPAIQASPGDERFEQEDPVEVTAPLLDAQDEVELEAAFARLLELEASQAS